MTMKFDRLNDFIKEKEEKLKFLKQLAEEEQKAKDELLELKARYESVIQQALREGKNRDDELLKIDKEIQEAQAKVRLAEHKRNTLSIIQEKAPKEELLQAFNADFTPKYKEKVLQPVLDKMLEVKKQAEEVAEEYRKVINDFENERESTIEELGDHYRYKLETVGFNYQEESEKYYITEKFARNLKY